MGIKKILQQVFCCGGNSKKNQTAESAPVENAFDLESDFSEISNSTIDEVSVVESVSRRGDGSVAESASIRDAAPRDAAPVEESVSTIDAASSENSPRDAAFILSPGMGYNNLSEGNNSFSSRISPLSNSGKSSMLLDSSSTIHSSRPIGR